MRATVATIISVASRITTAYRPHCEINFSELTAIKRADFLAAMAWRNRPQASSLIITGFANIQPNPAKSWN
jgi:hypothetical protein